MKKTDLGLHECMDIVKALAAKGQCFIDEIPEVLQDDLTAFIAGHTITVNPDGRRITHDIKAYWDKILKDGVSYPVRWREKPKFKNGIPVIINKNLVGIVFSSYLWTCMDARKFMYRLIVSAQDCMYRIRNNEQDQTKEPDLFKEDYCTLLYHTDQVGVMELFEEDLALFEPHLYPNEYDTDKDG